MFDVGFWELLFIFTLALLILGPDKLPGVVSTVGRWTGRARALARGLRLQIEREMAEDQTVQRPAAKPAPPKQGRSAASEETAAAGAAFGAGTADQSGSSSTGETATRTSAAADTPSEASAEPATDRTGAAAAEAAGPEVAADEGGPNETTPPAPKSERGDER